ncbi:MAG: DUF4363 family protein [Acutalibacteraceae bacterium]
MNRTIIAVLIVAVSAALSIGSLIAIENKCNDMIDRLDTILESAVKEETEQTKILAQNIYDQWEENDDLLILLIGMGDASDIKSGVDKVLYFAMIEDAPSVVLYADECKTDLKRIISFAEPNLSAIF